MNIYNMNLGILGANCYIIETAPGQCAAIDIGGSPERFLEFISNKSLRLSKILLTHGHYDHVGGVEDVRESTGARVFIHPNDATKLRSADESLASVFNPRAFRTIKEFTCVEDGQIIKDGNCEIKVFHTPGHTAGSVCYICNDKIFTGDTLFHLSVGRTDFPDGSTAALRKSLSRLASLNGDYNVLPGHNESTSLELERKNNPFLEKI